MYGTQAYEELFESVEQFENDVKTYGTPARFLGASRDDVCVTDVTLYGTQAGI